MAVLESGNQSVYYIQEQNPKGETVPAGYSGNTCPADDVSLRCNTRRCSHGRGLEAGIVALTPPELNAYNARKDKGSRALLLPSPAHARARAHVCARGIKMLLLSQSGGALQQGNSRKERPKCSLIFSLSK